MGESGPEKPEKRPRGRPKGSPSPKSYYSPPKGAKPAELRQWLLQQSDALETLCRMARGRRYRSYGPTGKVVYRVPSEQQQLWALDRVLRRCMPELSGLQLSGEQGADPIRLEASRGTGLENKDHELARRLMLAINMGAPEALSESEDAPINGGHYLPPQNGNGAQPAPTAPTHVMPADGPGEVQPPVGQAVVIDTDKGISITRLSWDGRPDQGGDWSIRKGDEELRRVRGVTQEGVARVCEALIEELSGG